MEGFIHIKGARAHNLKNVSVKVPKGKIVVITGLSGSGKSSLAFDTIYGEAERRFVESLSSYARQFLGTRGRPEVEDIKGLSPAIAIDSRSVAKNPRSTVGTITEIYDYLRVLFARLGSAACPECGSALKNQTVEDMVRHVMRLPKGSFVLILAPIVRNKRGAHKKALEDLADQGFLRVRLDGGVMRIEEALDLALEAKKFHSIEAVVDRLIIDQDTQKERLKESFETALVLGGGMVIVVPDSEHSASAKNKRELVFAQNLACLSCFFSMPLPEARLFSFNSPHGACGACKGLGVTKEVDPELVIPNKNLTLAEGAIRPWARAFGKGKSSKQLELERLGQKHGFSVSEPVKNLSKKAMDLILYGEEGEGEDKFEGVVDQIKERWQKTDSDWIRGELEKYMREKKCAFCDGARLNKEALSVFIDKKNIAEIANFSVSQGLDFFKKLSGKLSGKNKKIAEPLIKEIIRRFNILSDVGLDYLSLDRSTLSLAGGEAQRIRLATQISSDLSGIIYVLDEPSAGLHPRDHNELIKSIKNLRDGGNTVLIVEHDRQTMENADWLIDLGPGAGKDGGKIVFEGEFSQLKKARTLTGDYAAGRKSVEVIKNKAQNTKFKTLKILGAEEHNLKKIDVNIPLGNFVCVSGVSGSGKSSLINDILARALSKHFYKAKEMPGKHKSISGLKNIDKVVVVDQSPIGRTPRSNPATYTGAFSVIRELYAGTHEARNRGLGAGHFSFNVKGGRCEECEGQGTRKVEMHFLPDIYIECDECQGRRYNKSILLINYNGKNIAEVLDMSIDEALQFFRNIPNAKSRLDTLVKVGLGYMKLGQPATTLSGGEAQRIKLATELSKKETGKTLYILDEPTTGLHFDDIKKLLTVLRALVDRGNTVLVVEHNLDVIKNSDWVIDLGPEGGDKGGEIVVEGPPDKIAKNKKSYTGEWLKKVL